MTRRKQLIEDLSRQLRQVEQTRRRPGLGRESLSTGISALDRLLPGQGLPPGTLSEWLSVGSGSGAGTLAFTVTANLLRINGKGIVIDPQRTFYPSVSSGEGMTVVHPPDEREAVWVWEQSLRCPGVAVVIGWLGRLANQTYRRLQLAAETGGTLGFLLRPAEFRSQPSWADVRLQVKPLPTRDCDEGRLLTVELVDGCGRACTDIVKLDIDDETGDVRLVPPLAAATNSICSTGA